MNRAVAAVHVGLLVAGRQLRSVVASPALALPPPVASVAFLAAFAGGLGALGDLPGLDFPGGYTGFCAVYLIVVSAAFGGVLSGLALVEDYEAGMVRRLLLAPVARGAVLAGYVAAGVVRGLVTAVIVAVVACASGVPAPSAQAGIGVLGLCALVATATGLWSVAVGVRSQSTAAGAVMQLPVFLALFAGPVFAPEEFQAGWLDRVGAVNPLAHAVTASRSLVAGTSNGLGSAVVMMVGLITVLSWWVGRSAAGAGSLER